MSNLVIVGASARAAAMSALRAGLSPWCADLFADVDLVNIAPVRKIASEHYPDALVDLLKEAPPGAWMYTGALENRPDLIACVDRPLFGNTADVVRAIRSPERWTACLQVHGLAYPALTEQPRLGRWLLKPRRGAGGTGIREYAGQIFNPRTHFLQAFVEGVACSAIYHADHDEAQLLGVTEQLIGEKWLHAREFCYAGNIGPLDVDLTPWRAIGAALAETFHVRGLFGVDAILNDGVPWPVEINPRYTASVEVLERSLSVRSLAFPVQLASAKPQAAKCGKAILFARETFTFPTDGPWRSALHSTIDSAEYADIPHAGDVVERGRPVLTIFANGSTIEDCRRALQEKAQALDRRLWG